MRSRDILSGKEKGAATVLLRLLLRFLSGIYAIIIFCRNKLYDVGLRKAVRLSVPVICVGNITAGGTGKTPMVIWVCRQLQKQGKKLAILSRGYKSKADSDNDENRLLQEFLPDVPVIVDADRVRGGRRAIAEYAADMLVMDDGFQHRRLARDLNLVMIDATCPFGYEWLLPAGLLREPLAGLLRADMLVISRSDQVSTEALTELENRLADLTSQPGKDPLGPRDSIIEGPMIANSCHVASGLYDINGEEYPLETLAGKKVYAFCGIGQPEAFAKTLIGLEAEVIGHEEFVDHHHYLSDDVSRLVQTAQKQGAEMMVTTQKDWVKIGSLAKNLPIPLYWLKVAMELTRGGEELVRRLESV